MVLAVKREQHQGLVLVFVQELLVTEFLAQLGGLHGVPLTHQAGQLGVTDAVEQAPGHLDLFGGLVPGLLVLVTLGQAEHALAPEPVQKVVGGQGIHVLVGRNHQELADARQIQVGGCVLGNRIAEVDLQVFHACLADILPVGVSKSHWYLILLQGLANHPGHRVGAQDQETVFRGFGDFQQACDRPRCEALQGDGGNDQHEHQGYKGSGALIAQLLELEGEQR